jgi:hypothetical protein
MNKTLGAILFILLTIKGTGQTDRPLSPENNQADHLLLNSGTSTMDWSMVRDITKFPIGKVKTKIIKGDDEILVVTEILARHSQVKWVDSTIVGAINFHPIYHSSYNRQRELIMTFSDSVKGQYKDVNTGKTIRIAENTHGSYFDSNFYPHIIRLLPLKTGYSKQLSIFDYNPQSRKGVMSATIQKTEEVRILINEEERKAWKIIVTDDISDNQLTSIYFVDQDTRQLLRQEVISPNGKMIFELLSGPTQAMTIHPQGVALAQI